MICQPLRSTLIPNTTLFRSLPLKIQKNSKNHDKSRLRPTGGGSSSHQFSTTLLHIRILEKSIVLKFSLCLLNSSLCLLNTIFYLNNVYRIFHKSFTECVIFYFAHKYTDSQ